jgi:hypothetical protein
MKNAICAKKDEIKSAYNYPPSCLRLGGYLFPKRVFKRPGDYSVKYL